MKTLTTALALTLSLFLSVNLHAQVTIGSTETPASGAILDLKQAGTTTKGLGLPRVKLVKRVDSDISTTINGVAAGAYPGDHTGLLVYNVADESNPYCAAIPSGLYVWNGSEWQPIGSDPFGPVETYTDQDGNAFYARQFGNAGTWMTQNLAAKHYAKPDGTADTDNPIPFTQSYYSGDELVDPLIAYPNANENGSIPYGSVDFSVIPSTWRLEQGILYNWQAATKSRKGSDGTTPVGSEGQGQADESDSEGIQGICPKGWHLPNDREWNVLEKELTENASLYSESTANSVWNTIWENATWALRGTHGAVMKSQCPLPNSTYPAGGNSLSLSKGGFNTLLVGQVDVSYTQEYGEVAYIWTASNNSPINAWFRILPYNKDSVEKSDVYYHRSLMSVRCKKN
ncbi:FISUMP domain-containing protein [Dysgonomonas sp. 25]|uniref:FISUMP domain-containing protein n=1 Tax=Dysgonomonas sp. 25 TaxID=2302933 RepID=UPI0013D7463E|nr:FISUMP domain-containing protein [Dysgonomonas sp. 25]NDV69209.1 hypothetical protein [Dysgonomonas sp. 25]